MVNGVRAWIEGMGRDVLCQACRVSQHMKLVIHQAVMLA